MYKLLNVYLSIPLILIIAACGSQEDVTVQINEHLEETVQIEKTFDINQEKIFELEKEDEELYNEIIGLGSNDLEKVQTLSKQAIELLDERLEYVEQEKISLEESKTEFKKIEPLIEKIADEDKKEHTKEMYDTMMKRYDAYEDVYKSYSGSIQLTKELYSSFQEETFNENKVYSVIGNVNDSYDDVLKANELFNKETVLYNNLKEEYYETYQKE